MMGGMKMGMGIEDLERLNKLPKTITSPEMDLEKLKRLGCLNTGGDSGGMRFRE